MTKPASLVLTLLTCALLSGCAAERMYRQGVARIDNGQLEEGLELLRQVTREAPTDLQYQATYRRQRERILTALLEGAEQARRDMRYDEAEALLERVRTIDKSNARIDTIARDITRDRPLALALRKAEKLAIDGQRDAAAELLVKIDRENPDLKGATELRTRLERLDLAMRKNTPVLKARQARPVSLQFRDTSLPAVLDVLSRDTGINFILDKDVRPDTRITMFAQQVRIEEAIDLLLIPVQLEKKIISENTVLIYPATAAKQKEYQDLLLRSFYIQNTDLKQAMGMLKTMLKLRDVFIDERVNLLVVRDTPDVVRMAERLIAALDVPEPEVMLEVEVMEITRTSETSIGAKFPESLTITDGKLVNGLDSNIAINLKSAEGRSNLLSNPRIRVKSRQKARVLIGERVPVISSTTTPTQSGATVALVSQQIQYLDIGLKLEVEPTVNMDDSVSIKLNLEVNTLGEKVETQTGAVAYRVGTRTTNTVLELKDGETQVLAGLIRDDGRRTANRLPIIGEFPLLDRLFGNVSTEGNKTEIVLSITPRLLRTVRRANLSDQESWSGTETNYRGRPLIVQSVGRDARAAGAEARPAPAAGPAGASSSAATGTAAAPGTTGNSAASAEATPPAAPADAAPPAAPAPEAAFDINWLGSTTTRVGQELSVVLNLRSTASVSSASFQLQFDPAAVQILSVDEGGFLRQDQQATTFNHTIDPAGRIYGGVARTSGTGVAGTGAITVIRLRAKPGAQAIQVQPLTIAPIGADGRVMPAPELLPFRATVVP